MYSKTIILVFLLHACRNICSTRIHQTPPKYDISKLLGNSINALFENVGTLALGKFIKQMEYHHDRFDYPLENGTMLKELDASIMGSLGRKLDCNFLTNELRITLGHLYTAVHGSIRKDEHSMCSLSMMVNFDNFSIHMTDPCFVDISHSKVETSFNAKNEKIRGCFWNANEFTDEQRERVKKSIRSVLPKLVIDLIRNNDKFTEALNTSAFRWPKKEIISKIPDFQRFEQQYYYFIPEVRFPLFNLKNITIRGLSNFHSFKSDDELDDFAHVLTIGNIRGNLTLDYKGVNETSAKFSGLDFTADRLVISVSSDRDRVNVQTQDYRVIGTESDAPLSFDQSAMMMHYIESAIASDLIRFKKVWWKETQSLKRYDSEDQVKKLLNGITSKKGLYDYQISFHNITVKLVSGIPYPQQIHCEFPNNLNITHRINAKPIGNLRLNNEQDSTIDINFHANFTSISFFVVNPDNSRENDTCEFQIHPNEDIKVEFFPPKNASKLNNDESKLKTKIDQTLNSVTKERFTQNIKSTVCSPFNFCAKSATVVNDYLQGFIKNVLGKCSLIGNPTE